MSLRAFQRQMVGSPPEKASISSMVAPQAQSQPRQNGQHHQHQYQSEQQPQQQTGLGRRANRSLYPSGYKSQQQQQQQQQQGGDTAYYYQQKIAELEALLEEKDATIDSVQNQYQRLLGEYTLLQEKYDHDTSAYKNTFHEYETEIENLHHILQQRTHNHQMLENLYDNTIQEIYVTLERNNIDLVVMHHIKEDINDIHQRLLDKCKQVPPPTHAMPREHGSNNPMNDGGKNGQYSHADKSILTSNRSDLLKTEEDRLNELFLSLQQQQQHQSDLKLSSSSSTENNSPNDAVDLQLYHDLLRFFDPSFSAHQNHRSSPGNGIGNHFTSPNLSLRSHTPHPSHRKSRHNPPDREIDEALTSPLTSIEDQFERELQKVNKVKAIDAVQGEGRPHPHLRSVTNRNRMAGVSTPTPTAPPMTRSPLDPSTGYTGYDDRGHGHKHDQSFQEDTFSFDALTDAIEHASTATATDDDDDDGALHDHNHDGNHNETVNLEQNHDSTHPMAYDTLMASPDGHRSTTTTAPQVRVTSVLRHNITSPTPRDVQSSPTRKDINSNHQYILRDHHHSDDSDENRPPAFYSKTYGGFSHQQSQSTAYASFSTGTPSSMMAKSTMSLTKTTSISKQQNSVHHRTDKLSFVSPLKRGLTQAHQPQGLASSSVSMVRPVETITQTHHHHTGSSSSNIPHDMSSTLLTSTVHNNTTLLFETPMLGPLPQQPSQQTPLRPSRFPQQQSHDEPMDEPAGSMPEISEISTINLDATLPSQQRQQQYDEDEGQHMTTHHHHGQPPEHRQVRARSTPSTRLAVPSARRASYFIRDEDIHTMSLDQMVTTVLHGHS